MGGNVDVIMVGVFKSFLIVEYGCITRGLFVDCNNLVTNSSKTSQQGEGDDSHNFATTWKLTAKFRSENSKRILSLAGSCVSCFLNGVNGKHHF